MAGPGDQRFRVTGLKPLPWLIDCGDQLRGQMHVARALSALAIPERERTLWVHRHAVNDYFRFLGKNELLLFMEDKNDPQSRRDSDPRSGKNGRFRRQNALYCLPYGDIAYQTCEFIMVVKRGCAFISRQR